MSGPPAGGHTEQEVATSALCECGSAERRGGVLCADPAYVVTPQEKHTHRDQRHVSARRIMDDLRRLVALERSESTIGLVQCR
jgi:hypothetical protein